MGFDADAAIVGYGPVGQALTAALGSRGHSVLVLERWPTFYSLPRAVPYNHEAARILQSLGAADEMQGHQERVDREEANAACLFAASWPDRFRCPACGHAKAWLNRGERFPLPPAL
jgi:2-polyprenyl-6-methoxyphenol hydroxylase-like FAD-dependent oxidoreductase